MGNIIRIYPEAADDMACGVSTSSQMSLCTPQVPKNDPRMFDEELNTMWEREIMSNANSCEISGHAETIAVLQSTIEDQSETHRVILDKFNEQSEKLTRLSLAFDAGQKENDTQKSELTRLTALNNKYKDDINALEAKILLHQDNITEITKMCSGVTTQLRITNDTNINLEYQIMELKDENRTIKMKSIEINRNNDQLDAEWKRKHSDLMRKYERKEDLVNQLQQQLQRLKTSEQEATKNSNQLMLKVNELGRDRLWQQNALWANVFKPFIIKRKIFNDARDRGDAVQEVVPLFGHQFADVWDFIIVPVKKDFFFAKNVFSK